MKLQYRELAEQLALEEAESVSVAPATLERIQVQTMNKINSNAKEGRRLNRSRKKWKVMPVAAAITAFALVGSAAAYTISSNSLQGFFRSHTEEGQFGAVETASLNESQSQALDSLTTTDLAPISAGGSTVTPLEAVCDGYDLYLVLQVEAPEGTVLPDYDEADGYAYHLFSYDEDFSFTKESGMYSSELWVQPDEDPTDNVKTFVLSLRTDGLETDGNALTLPGLYVEDGNKDYTALAEGPWTIDLSACAKSETLTPDVEGLQVADSYSQEDLDAMGVDEVSYTLESLTISTLSLHLTYHPNQDINDDEVMPEPSISLIFADDTQVELQSGMGMALSEKNVSFSAPIDLSQLESVVICGTEIAVR